MTDKFARGFHDRMKPKTDFARGENVVEPFRDAQLSLWRGQFATKERTEFFDEAFIDILTDLFHTWLKTEPHCVKEREFLYHTALALGSVKEKMIAAQNLGRNAAYIQRPQEEEDEDKQ